MEESRTIDHKVCVDALYHAGEQWWLTPDEDGALLERV